MKENSALLGAFAELRMCLLASSCLSVHMELLGYHWTSFCEIYYFNIVRKSAEKIQVSLKCDKNNGYFT